MQTAWCILCLNYNSEDILWNPLTTTLGISLHPYVILYKSIYLREVTVSLFGRQILNSADGLLVWK